MTWRASFRSAAADEEVGRVVERLDDVRQDVRRLGLDQPADRLVEPDRPLDPRLAAEVEPGQPLLLGPFAVERQVERLRRVDRLLAGVEPGDQAGARLPPRHLGSGGSASSRRRGPPRRRSGRGSGPRYPLWSRRLRGRRGPARRASARGSGGRPRGWRTRLGRPSSGRAALPVWTS